jgi:uncharacterized membrane protein
MAGMLYLPRLFVYHCETEAGSKQSETFKVMERRLLKAIINPVRIAAIQSSSKASGNCPSTEKMSPNRLDRAA